MIKNTQNASNVDDNCVINLQNVDQNNNVVSLYPVPYRHIADMIKYIGYKNAPLDQMVGVLSAVQNLFYPTDNAKHDNMMEYYRQREWRIVVGFGNKEGMQARPLNDEEKNVLLGIDSQFWSKTISDNKISIRRVDSAYTIKYFAGNNISEIISSIIVPSNAYDSAKSIFGDSVVIKVSE